MDDEMAGGAWPPDWDAEEPGPATSAEPPDALLRLRERALQLTVRRLAPGAALAWVRRLDGMPHLKREALVAAGALGDPVLVPWLLDQMCVPALARLAGDAFASITGADLTTSELRGAAPADFHGGPSDDADDKDVGLDVDENLPWPDVARVGAWWAARHETFEAARRLLLGRKLDGMWSAQVLRRGVQPHRSNSALELALQYSGWALFEVRAPASRQQVALGV